MISFRNSQLVKYDPELKKQIEDTIAKKKNSWNFKKIVEKAYASMPEDGEKSKFISRQNFRVRANKCEKFSDVWNTFPTGSINTIKELLAKHDFFLPSVMPSGLNSEDYILDLDSTEFKGPFFNHWTRKWLVQQENPALPLFCIFWDDDSSPDL